MNMKYLIIGNGIAGTEAALAIRKNDPDGEISIISQSQHLFYYRPRLIDYLADEIPLDRFTVYKSEFYDKMNIRNILGTKIEKINTREKKAISGEGSEFEYDKLLLATGADCFVPRIDGVDKKGVFSLRGVFDADNIKAYCKDITDVVLVGGGLLGLEVAFSLTKLGLKVTCVEFFDRLLPRQLDQEGAGLLKRLLEEKGLSFVFPDSVAAIEGEGKVGGVVLRSGKQLKADAVIICAGIRVRDKLAREAGIEVSKGIVVDDHMRTSVDNISAAGDAIQHQGRLYGLWPAAKEQGRIAGLNMAGVSTRYKGTVPSSTLKVTGIDLYSAGDFDSEEGEALTSKEDGVYRKFVFTDSKPVGAIVLGDPQAIRAASEVFEGKAAPEEFKMYF
jgi:nitrite reductase (NADH) large subunit